jgi:hypothetical protein
MGARPEIPRLLRLMDGVPLNQITSILEIPARHMSKLSELCLNHVEYSDNVLRELIRTQSRSNILAVGSAISTRPVPPLSSPSPSTIVATPEEIDAVKRFLLQNLCDADFQNVHEHLTSLDYLLDTYAKYHPLTPSESTSKETNYRYGYGH